MWTKPSIQPEHQASHGFWSRTAGVAAVGILMCCVGCGFDSESIETLQKVSFQQHELVGGFADATPTLSNPEAVPTSFQPPFPDRDNPFVVMQGSNDDHLSREIGTHDVQVLGFAKLDQQQAILRVGGETRFVIVGDRVGGLEVIAIAPPRVRIKSGNLVWDANMYAR